MIFAAWVSHTDRSRELAQDVSRALEMAGLSRKAAAEDMGLTEPQLSRQLSGAEPLNLWRLCALGAAFDLALLRRRAARIGAALFASEEVEMLKGAARLGPHRVAAMVGESDTAERRTA